MSRYPWTLIGLLWVVAFLNAADRSILVAVMPQLEKTFHLEKDHLALLNSLFFWIYAISAFLFGRVGDTVRRSRVILYGLIFWSVATGTTATATGFMMLLALRGIVALGESTYYPTATALISDWHRPEMRSRALSIHQTAVLVGHGLGAYFAGRLADQYGWRSPFLIFAVVGLLHAVVLSFMLKDAPTQTEKKVNKEPLSLVLKIRPALMMCVVFFLGNGASTGLTVWAPTFVHDRFGLELADSALYGSMTISMAGFAGIPLGGFLADWAAKRSLIGRFYVLALGLGLAGVLLLLLGGADSANLVAAVLIATSFGKGIFDGCVYAAVHDVVPSWARGTAVGLMTLIGFLGAGITPLYVSRMSKVMGMQYGLTSLAGLYFIAVLILLAMRASTRQAVKDNIVAEAH